MFVSLCCNCLLIKGVDFTVIANFRIYPNNNFIATYMLHVKVKCEPY